MVNDSRAATETQHHVQCALLLDVVVVQKDLNQLMASSTGRGTPPTEAPAVP
jgi:hypothetical protein